MNIKHMIKNNFSRYATSYDAYCSVQNKVALKLLDNLNGQNFKKILDIGCGTGNYTSLLSNKFPTSKIIALDISSEMIGIAKRKLQNHRVEFITADAETIKLADNFELVTSNSCFQWFGNLENGIARYEKLLTNNGILLYSVLGPLTFCELGKSLAQLYNKDIQITSETFMNKDRLLSILSKYFASFSVHEETLKKGYGSLMDLLNSIKYTGTRGVGLNGKSFNKGQITKLEKIYREKYGNITATYQVFYCTGRKNNQ